MVRALQSKARKIENIGGASILFDIEHQDLTTFSSPSFRQQILFLGFTKVTANGNTWQKISKKLLRRKHVSPSPVSLHSR
jgi:hypothetical protein